LKAPDLPFVIGVMGVGGPTESYEPSQQRVKTIHENFRNAMAAVASMDEFKGTVASVRTAAFWDMEVTALRARERELKPRVDEINARAKDGSLTREAAQAEVEGLYGEAFTPLELRVLRESVSNAEYHYLGSAKIMARIGRAFADAMADLMARPGR
ncbi:MAG: hypothetical protein KDA28_09925, partial [Phycisphaerales bacterium]|nr:hypothetical protein [Phycisphaerales bacterium]